MLLPWYGIFLAKPYTTFAADSLQMPSGEKEEPKSYTVVQQVFTQKSALGMETLGNQHLTALSYQYDSGNLEPFLCEAELLYARTQLLDEYKLKHIRTAIISTSFSMEPVNARRRRTYKDLCWII